MFSALHYRKLAQQARRLAEAMHQPDVIEVLQSAAREYDGLADRAETEAREDDISLEPIRLSVPC
jgi:hypothetical protein